MLHQTLSTGRNAQMKKIYRTKCSRRVVIQRNAWWRNVLGFVYKATACRNLCLVSNYSTPFINRLLSINDVIGIGRIYFSRIKSLCRDARKSWCWEYLAWIFHTNTFYGAVRKYGTQIRAQRKPFLLWNITLRIRTLYSEESFIIVVIHISN